jgi:transposase-like protein
MSKEISRAHQKWKNRYSFSFKKEVIASIENGQLSQNQASYYYNVGRKTISEWLKRYGNFDKKLREMGGKSPKQTIDELREKLRNSESENAAMKAVFEILTEEYGDDLIKKHFPGLLGTTLTTRKKK